MDVFYDSHHGMFPVNKNHVNGKSHEKHVDAIAAGDEERLPIFERSAVKKPGQARKKRIHDGDAVGEDGVLGGIKDH